LPEELDIPLENEPGGVAERSMSATATEQVEMILTGGRPATLFAIAGEGSPHPSCETAQAALNLARSTGLVIVFYHEVLPCGCDSNSAYVGRVTDDTRRLLYTRLVPWGSLDYHIALGRALGYSERDIHHFCERYLRIYRACDIEGQLTCALRRARPRPPGF
jgi:hypothetical protein